jgi:hypothetical protein
VRKKSGAGLSRRGRWHRKLVGSPKHILRGKLHTYLSFETAGVIHGDFERGFIKAEVVAYQDFHDLCEGNKSMGPIKSAGKFRQEGKTYVRINLVVTGGFTKIIHRWSKMEILSISSSVGCHYSAMCTYINRV